jgi:hypothetical protein
MTTIMTWMMTGLNWVEESGEDTGRRWRRRRWR